jgi:hypothetical protein
MITTESFTERARTIHEDRYLYDRVVYTGASNKVEIGCKLHGYFWQEANSHVRGSGCILCRNSKATSTTTVFIRKAQGKHGDTYLYDRVQYITVRKKVEIGCKVEDHGYFWQTPNSHLRPSGCPKCRIHKIVAQTTSTRDEFVSNAESIHGDTYLYDRVEYKGSLHPVEIGCMTHGYFMQTPNKHIQGGGCTKCGNISTANAKRLSLSEIIEKFVLKHEDLYIYDRVNYTCSNIDVEIGCRVEDHGYFWQRPYVHYSGSGCPKCKLKNEGKVGAFLEEILPDHNIIHNKSWGCMGSRRPDFRVPELFLILEYDGEQHFRDVEKWGPCSIVKKIDTWKMLMSKSEGYTTIRIPYTLLKMDNWREILLPCIKKYDSPMVRYMQRSTGIYDGHIDLLGRFRSNPSLLLV